MTLRENLVAEFATLGTAISEAKDQVLRLELMEHELRRRNGKPVGYEFCKLLVVVFDSIYRCGEGGSSAHSMTTGLFQKTVGAMFSITVPENVIDVYAPEYNYDLFLNSVKVEGDDVLVTVKQWVRYAPVETHKPRMEWVQVDETTRKLQPALNKDKKPITIKKTADPKMEKIDFTYRLPLTFFVHLLGEIGRDSIIESVPNDYVPAALGMSVLVQQFISQMPSFMLHPKMLGMRGGKPSIDDGAWPEHRVATHGLPPFRLFLKPEPGSDRMEVVVESYPEEQVRAHKALQDQHRNWAEWKVKDTETFKQFEADLRQRKAAAAPAPDAVAG